MPMIAPRAVACERDARERPEDAAQRFAEGLVAEVGRAGLAARGGEKARLVERDQLDPGARELGPRPLHEAQRGREQPAAIAGGVPPGGRHYCAAVPSAVARSRLSAAI